MATLDNATLRTLINLAREAVVARTTQADGEAAADLDECRDTLAIAERALADSQERLLRTERLEAALSDCYVAMHDLRIGYREHELPKNPHLVEREARELLGIVAPVRQAID